MNKNNPQQKLGLFSDKAFDKNSNSKSTADDQQLSTESMVGQSNNESQFTEGKNTLELQQDTHNDNNLYVLKDADDYSNEEIKATLEPKKTTLGYGEPLKLAVVGHTNTGKTSILRTLLRDKYFGEVQNAAATTRHVERAIIKDTQTNENLVALYDTPGLEDASGVMDWLENNTSSRRDGIDRLQHFLTQQSEKLGNNTHLNSDYDFSQEAKVVRQLLGSDIAIYVIDAREPVLGKYKDELTILSWSAIPVMPVFNFTTSQDNYITEWQTMLARRNLHISTKFDSIAFEFNDEIKLWNNLATMLTDDGIIKQLIQRRKENWQIRQDEATIFIADFLLNVASYVKEIDENDDPMPTLTEMQEAVRQAERKMQTQLTELYKFYDSEVAPTPVSLTEYQQDPFDTELLKTYGIRTTSGAAAGALFGMGIDAAALGTTLGLGTALGGLAGGILSNTGKIADMITGKKHLYIDPETLTLLATRSIHLLEALKHRGHAATDNIQYDQQVNTDDTPALPWVANKIPQPLKKARSRLEWSSLGGSNPTQAETLRKDAAWELSSYLNIANAAST